MQLKAFESENVEVTEAPMNSQTRIQSIVD
jgi:hypothetical protein